MADLKQSVIVMQPTVRPALVQRYEEYKMSGYKAPQPDHVVVKMDANSATTKTAVSESEV